MKKYISILLAFSILFSLSGCGTSVTAETETSAKSIPDPIIEDHISYNSTQGQQSLSIEAEISLPETIPSERFILSFDEDARENLFKTLIKDPKDLAHEDQDGRIVGITFDTETPYGSTPGDIYYEDHRKTDWHEKSLDNEKFWEPGYFSPYKPGNFSKSSKEAAEEFADFLNAYSCLDFVPLRAESREGADGAYYVHFKTTFQGLPVLSRDLHIISGQIRETGIEGFQGHMLLKEADKQPIENPLSLQEAIERFKTDSFENSYARLISIDQILLCYVAMPQGDSWVLSPSWIFLGRESGGYTDPFADYHMGDSLPIAYLYDLNDGFLDIMDSNTLHFAF